VPREKKSEIKKTNGGLVANLCQDTKTGKKQKTGAAWIPDHKGEAR